MPSLMMGAGLERHRARHRLRPVRQPLGVFAAIAPFNFPSMVPLWFLPFAIATGNTFVLKPSEQVPLSQQRIFELLDELRFPPGVVNPVNGAQGRRQRLCEHHDVAGVSFVGSTPVASHVYRAATHGQARPGPRRREELHRHDRDATGTSRSRNIVDSSLGCAGQRCLAGASSSASGDAYGDAASARPAAREGQGRRRRRAAASRWARSSARAHKDKVLGYIEKGVARARCSSSTGAASRSKAARRATSRADRSSTRSRPEMAIAREEIFGPVLCVLQAKTLADAIAHRQAHPLRQRGVDLHDERQLARALHQGVDAAMVGVNIGVAAPMASSPSAARRTASSATSKPTAATASLLHAEQDRYQRWW